jgi:hypothetical protein
MVFARGTTNVNLSGITVDATVNATLHAGPTFNGSSGNDTCAPVVGTPAVGNNNDLAFHGRWDVAASVASFPYTSGIDSASGVTSHWLQAPSVAFSITTSADAVTAIGVYVHSDSVTQPALLQQSLLNDGKTTVITSRSLVHAFDGCVDMRTNRTSATIGAATTKVVWIPEPSATTSIAQSSTDVKDEKYVLVPSANPPSPTPSVLDVASNIKNYFAGSINGNLPVSAYIGTAKAMMGK